MNVKHILLTTDLSDESLRPCEAISEFAKSIGARITLLHVLQDLRIAPHGAPLAPAVSTEDMTQAAEKARASLEELAGKIEGEVSVDVAVHESIPRGVVDYATRHDVDMIAMSTHGRTGFRHLVLGSVAEAVLRHSSVAVLCFPRVK
jgi:nucleotide-binding universal stress UspA family protein